VRPRPRARAPSERVPARGRRRDRARTAADGRSARRPSAARARRGGLGRTEDAVEPGAPGSFRRDQDASDRTDAAVEGELPDGRMLLELRNGDLVRRGEDRERNREVEAGALLLQGGRGEVDRDAVPAARPVELGGDDPALDALLRLLAGAVGQADDGEAGHAAVEVRLDLDTACVQADERMRDCACEHGSTLAPKRARIAHPSAPKVLLPFSWRTVHTRSRGACATTQSGERAPGASRRGGAPYRLFGAAAPDCAEWSRGGNWARRPCTRATGAW
jgi:hypothetical protein